MELCEGLSELRKTQIKAILLDYARERCRIAKKENKSPEEIEWDRAVKEEMERKYVHFTRGFKYLFCNNVCNLRQNCQIRNKELEKYEQYIPAEVRSKYL